MWLLTFNVILEYQGLIFRDFLWFFLGFFFQSDRLTQHQETHSTLNEKKEDGLSNLEKVLNFSGRLEKSLKFTTLSKPDTILCKLN